MVQTPENSSQIIGFTDIRDVLRDEYLTRFGEQTSSFFGRAFLYTFFQALETLTPYEYPQHTYEQYAEALEQLDDNEIELEPEELYRAVRKQLGL